MLSLRARIFIVVSLILLLVLGISIFLLVRSKKQKAIDNAVVTVENLPGNNNLPITAPILVANISNNIKVTPASSLEAQQNAVEQLAKIFIERMNSYSSESQYQNVRDVQSLVSKTYWIQLSAKLPSGSAVQNTTAPFSSTITKAYSSKLSLWDENNAIVQLQVKITDEKSVAINNRDQQAKVYLIKDDQNWLVDKFEWVK